MQQFIIKILIYICLASSVIMIVIAYAIMSAVIFAVAFTVVCMHIKISLINQIYTNIYAINC